MFVIVKQQSEGLDCVFRVNNVHYHHEQYAEDFDLVGYDDEKYDQDYHSDNR